MDFQADKRLAAEGTTGPVELSATLTAVERLKKGGLLLRRRAGFSSEKRAGFPSGRGCRPSAARPPRPSVRAAPRAERELAAPSPEAAGQEGGGRRG